MSTVIFGTLKSEYLPPQPGRSGRSDATSPQRESAPTEQERGVQQRKIMGGEIRPTPSLKNEYALPTKLQGGHDLKKSIYTSYDELPPAAECEAAGGSHGSLGLQHLRTHSGG